MHVCRSARSRARRRGGSVGSSGRLSSRTCHARRGVGGVFADCLVGRRCRRAGVNGPSSHSPGCLAGDPGPGLLTEPCQWLNSRISHCFLGLDAGVVSCCDPDILRRQGGPGYQAKRKHGRHEDAYLRLPRSAHVPRIVHRLGSMGASYNRTDESTMGLCTIDRHLVDAGPVFLLRGKP